MGHQGCSNYVIHQARRSSGLIIAIVTAIYIFIIYIYLRSRAQIEAREQTFPTFSYNEAELSEFVEFVSSWCLQSKRRLDWDSVQKPCADNTRWGVSKPYYAYKNQTSTQKSFLSLWDVKSAGEFSRIGLQSVSMDGQNKVFGGDSWRVHIRGPSSVTPTVIDHDNGTYEVLFLPAIPGNYEVTMVLEYSLCDGHKEPPGDWFIKGNAQGKYQPPDALPGIEKPFLISSLWNGVPVIVKIIQSRKPLLAKYATLFPSFYPACDVKCKYIGDGEGYWVKNKWFRYTKRELRRPHARNTGTLWIYGDSNGDFFYKLIQKRPLCKDIFKQCNRTYNWVYKLPGGNQTLGKLLFDDLDFSVERILNEISEVLNDTSMRKANSSVIILNLGLHYVQNINFTKYRELIDRTIMLFKGGEAGEVGEIGRSYHGRMIWKTTTAMNREKYGDPRTGARHSKALRFLTYQRLLLYNAYATKAMCDAGFDILDVFPMTDSYPNGTGLPNKPYDAVHYPTSTFVTAVELLERYFGKT